ncbi:hypothetical protein XU18_4053 [Perkinsela sp. CCAP 1560/4]|nr:hypothetical protein XU18_4053 [Perkinsela sp. CCAP 1560/4]|eukprot:KNH04766.1 hypothetical protein XU18_4053 [Perkinsela sp. CCAP 1560/4]
MVCQSETDNMSRIGDKSIKTQKRIEICIRLTQLGQINHSTGWSVERCVVMLRDGHDSPSGHHHFTGRSWSIDLSLFMHARPNTTRNTVHARCFRRNAPRKAR